MTAAPRARRVLRGAEVALAFAAGVASFALVAVLLAVFESGLFAAVFGAACVAAVIAVARRWGVAYAVPAAMAALLGYDWYQFPPTHPEEFPSSGNLANLVVYLGVSVLVGELAASAARRAARLADEQAALRRVATLVARGVPPRRCSRRSPTRSASCSTSTPQHRPTGARRHVGRRGAWARTASTPRSACG